MTKATVRVFLGCVVLVVAAASGGYLYSYSGAAPQITEQGICAAGDPPPPPASRMSEEQEITRVLSSAEAEVEARRVLAEEFRVRRAAPEYAHFSPADHERSEAQAILFWVSRNSNDAQLRHKLRKAFNEKLINEDDYYGELSHMLSVPGTENLEVFREIVAARNKYGLQVLYFELGGSPAGLENFSPAEKREVLVGLLSVRPTFEPPISELGLSELANFENWSKALEHAYEGPSFNDFLYEKVVITAEEARDLLALESVGYLQRLRSSNRYDMTKVEQHFKGYQTSYPNVQVANLVLNRRSQYDRSYTPDGLAVRLQQPLFSN